MGDMIGDGAEYSCPFCTTKVKIKVLSSPTTGDGKKIANKVNHIFPPPGGMCNVIPNAPSPCVPGTFVVEEGQSKVKLSEVQGLGKGCKVLCARGGTLTVSTPGQGVSIHDGAGKTKPVSKITGELIDAANSNNNSEKEEEEKKKEKKKKPTKEEAKEKKGDYVVYRSTDPETGVQYVGITKDFETRGDQHRRKKGIEIKKIRGMKGLTKDQARGVEQVLIEHHGLGKHGGSLMNKINSISRKNPKYAKALEEGIELLKKNEYPGFN